MGDVYGKAIASIDSTEDDDKYGPNGGFHAILTNATLDRDGDKLDLGEWMPLEDRYPLDHDHEMSVAGTIGSYHPYVDGDDIVMDAYFSSIPKAQEVRTLVKEGHIRSVSVAFMTDKSKKSGEPRREMLNAGIVAVPSNRDSIITAAKAASVLREAISEANKADMADEVQTAVLEALKPEDKAAQPHASGMGNEKALLQAAHDAVVHLGAVCFPLQSNEDPTGADDGANKTGFDVNRVLVKWGEESKIFTEEEIHEGKASEWIKTFIEDVDTKSQTLQLEVPDGVDLDQFTAALTAFFTPAESPAESPAEETASEEEPVEEAAEDAAEDVDPDIRARDMAMALFATQF